MIKCKIDRCGLVRIRAKGTPHNLSVETCGLIAEIYQKMYASNEAAAEEYRRTILGTLIDPDSPVWKAERKEV